jgi:hypothetical protein
MILSTRCRTILDKFLKNWNEEQRGFYASWKFDQAKQCTKAAPLARLASIRWQSEQKKILLSLAPQDFHH